jgi:DNA repair ATPase RecN
MTVLNFDELKRELRNKIEDLKNMQREMEELERDVIEMERDYEKRAKEMMGEN